MRLAIVLTLVFGGGIAFGWFVAPTSSAPATVEPGARNRAEVERLSAQVAELQADRDRLTSESWDLTHQLSEVLDAQEASAATEAVQAADTGEEAQPDGQAGADDAERSGRRSRWSRSPSPEQQQQWAERRQSFEDRLNQMLTAQVAQMNDPAAGDRLDALMEWRDYQQDLRQQLRDAQTDEERNAVLAAMDEARQNARQLLLDQQNALLRDVATQSGIRGGKNQDQFVSALRQTLNSPFFQMDRMLVGGMPFGGRGQRGGRGGGGGSFVAPGDSQ